MKTSPPFAPAPVAGRDDVVKLSAFDGSAEAGAQSSGRHRQRMLTHRMLESMDTIAGPRRISRSRGKGALGRIATLAGLAIATAAIASFSTGTMPLRPDSSGAELARLGKEYGELQQWAAAIAEASDTLPADNTEEARVLADQLAKLMRPLEQDFERTTAALSTTQLESVLPLWERMAFAHAGFALLQEQAAELGGDPTMEPIALHNLANQLSAVLDFAAEVQQRVLQQLTTPMPTPIRLS